MKEDSLLRALLCIGNHADRGTHCGVCHHAFSFPNIGTEQNICWTCDLTMRIKKSSMHVMLSNLRYEALNRQLAAIDKRMHAARTNRYWKQNTFTKPQSAKSCDILDIPVGILKPPAYKATVAVVWDADLDIMAASPRGVVRSIPFSVHIPNVGDYSMYLLAKPNRDNSAVGLFVHAVGDHFPLHLNGTTFSCGQGFHAAVFCSPHNDVISFSGNGRGISGFLPRESIAVFVENMNSRSIIRFTVNIAVTYVTTLTKASTNSYCNTCPKLSSIRLTRSTLAFNYPEHKNKERRPQRLSSSSQWQQKY